jgi:hypothetical protein
MSANLFRFIIFVLIAFAPDVCPAADRVALVIGNSAYANVPKLTNPVNDATDVADALQRLQFDVVKLLDATYDQMNDAAHEFEGVAANAQIAVVFYAGHGVEANGENWLVPINARLGSQADAPNEFVSLQSLSSRVAKASKLGLIILDACRDNPFVAPVDNVEPTHPRSENISTRSTAKGLAPASPPSNVLVAFAAKDGSVARDGEGRNSPFSSSLLTNIETPGLEISALFRRVRDNVVQQTNGTQQPFVYGSISSEAIYLKPPPPALVRAFDGLWTTTVVCDGVGAQKGYDLHFIARIEDGIFSGQTGPLNKPNSTTFSGSVDIDGTLRIGATGYTGDPRITLSNARPGTPFGFGALGRLEKTRGTALRTNGRKCVFDLTKQHAADARGKRS